VDDNPLKEDDSDKVMFENSPEATPLGAESFSMRAQKDKFIGGASEKRVKSKEDIAMEKVKDIRENAWAHWLSRGKLTRVSESGLYSRNVAKALQDKQYLEGLGHTERS